METIRTLTDKDIGEKSAHVDKFSLRRAARAIVINENNEIAVMYVEKFKNHKLPGGGIEDGEDFNKALIREIKEETGAEIKVVGEIGIILEERSRYKLAQESICVIAKAVSHSAQNFTKTEIEQGFSLSWVPLNEAITLFEKDKPSDYTARFILERDLTFLKAYRETL